MVGAVLNSGLLQPEVKTAKNNTSIVTRYESRHELMQNTNVSKINENEIKAAESKLRMAPPLPVETGSGGDDATCEPYGGR